MSRRALVGVLLVAACAEHAPPAPRLLGVTPSRAPERVAVRIAISGENLQPRVVTDFVDTEESEVARDYRVHLGRVPLDEVGFSAEGALEATVPDRLAPGRYDLVVTDPWGRQAALPEVFEVVAEAAPISEVAGFRFEPIGPQQAGTPFDIALLAVDARGELVETFSGDVALLEPSGTLVPPTVSLARGRWQGPVEIRSPADEASIVAADGARSGASNLFPVRPRPPVGLRFEPAEIRGVAGQCSPAARLTLVDDREQLAAAGAEVPIVLETSDPVAVALFADAACSRTLEAPGFASGEGALTLYFEAAGAGPVWIQALASDLRGARLGGWVDPAAEARLAFVSSPQVLTAGECSAPVRIEVQDRFGNPAPAAASRPLALAAAPGPLAFFADAACSVEIGDVPVPVGSTGAAFHVRGTIAGARSLEASGAGLATAAQPVQVLPGAAARLAFVTEPVRAVAGACAGRVAVRVEDAFGNGSRTSAALPLLLAASPGAGVSFFADAACALPAGGLQLDPGTSETELSFVATAAGTLAVEASAAGVAPASQLEVVVPDAAVGIAFASPPQRVSAGACSAPVGVEGLDRFGNRGAAPAADVPLALAGAGGRGLAFYSDPACAQATSTATLEARSGRASFHFTATRAGPLPVRVRAEEWPEIEQVETVLAAAAAAFVWDPILQPLESATAFPVRVRAEDLYGNLATGYTGSALLSLLPGGTLTCTSGCGKGGRTEAFAAGGWSGEVAVESPGWALRLLASAGTVSGSSTPFDVLPPAAAPRAAFSAAPAAVEVGAAIAFDASASTDGQTAADALEVSWDFGGDAVGPPPWTPWTALKTASHVYPGIGTFTPRLAVRDAAGGIGYAARTVVVAPPGSLCTVNRDEADLDDGAAGCAGPFGPDGRLSLAEAIRLGNAGDGSTIITFDGARTLSGTAGHALGRSMSILAPPGVVLEGVALSVAAGEVLFSGLELRGAASSLTVRAGASATLLDVGVRDGASVSLAGKAELTRVAMRSCGASCVKVEGAQAGLRVRHSELLSSARTGTGILLRECGTGPVLDLQTSVLAGFEQAVMAESKCRAATLVRHATFAGNGWGLRYAGGSGHVLSGCIFSGHTQFAAFCPGAAFARRDASLLHANASDGCLAGDPDERVGDPRFVDSAGGDLRLRLDSPARDSAPLLGLDVNGEAPGAWFGAAPDRGARETP